MLLKCSYLPPGTFCRSSWRLSSLSSRRIVRASFSTRSLLLEESLSKEVPQPFLSFHQQIPIETRKIILFTKARHDLVQASSMFLCQAWICDVPAALKGREHIHKSLTNQLSSVEITPIFTQKHHPKTSFRKSQKNTHLNTLEGIKSHPKKSQGTPLPSWPCVPATSSPPIAPAPRSPLRSYFLFLLDKGFGYRLCFSFFWLVLILCFVSVLIFCMVLVLSFFGLVSGFSRYLWGLLPLWVLHIMLTSHLEITFLSSSFPKNFQILIFS